MLADFRRLTNTPRFWSFLFLGGLLAAGLLGPSVEANAAPAAGRWQIAESKNFRVLTYGQQPASAETLAACEGLRTSLMVQWFNSPSEAAWTPKCDLVLHPSDASYLREVGAGGNSTLASALVDRSSGKVSLRRVDVRASRGDWMTGALAHELAHVVLADRFERPMLPRWINEGAAILADSPSKRDRHFQDARHAVAAGRQFRLVELVALPDYPPAGRWGTFYDQSATLVAYLIDEGGHARFVSFVEQALDQGYEQATQSVYGCGLDELERRWKRSLDAPRARAMNVSHATAS